MVRMGMVEQQGVGRAASRIDELIAHVRSGIDQDMGIVLPQQDRRPPPPVPWLGRVAVSPGAIRQRHAAGTATAENGDPHHVASGLETRSEEHTSELQSLMRISYAVFCLKKKNTQQLK